MYILARLANIKGAARRRLCTFSVSTQSLRFPGLVSSHLIPAEPEGAMAKRAHTFLCFLLLLATLAECRRGFDNLDLEAGTIHVFNSADYNMTILNKVHFVDGHITVDPVYTPLPKQTEFFFQVMQSMDTVTTMFRMPTTADIPSYQVIIDWSSIARTMNVPCVPDCWWVVDNKGFSVADSKYSPLDFVIGWD